MRSWTARLIVIAALLGLSALRAQDRVLVLEGGTVIDGTGRGPIADAVVVIEGSRIKAVGAKGQVAYPPGAIVVSVQGRTVLPGLIDGHIHLRDYMPPMFLKYGVTTIADTHNSTAWSLLQREALRSGRIKGPRLFVSGERASGPSDNLGVPPSLPLKTVEEARAYVKSLVAQGVDVIKVDLTLSYDQLRAVIEEANAAGLRVVGHSQNIRKAAEVGLKYMEHTDTLGRAILEEMGPDKLRAGGATPERLMDTALLPPLIDFMVKQGVYVNPTMVARWRGSTPRGQEWASAIAEIVKDPGLAFVPPDVRESWTRPAGRADIEAYNKVAEFLRKYSEAGGKVLAATDAGFMPGLSLHYEMQMLTDVGVTPMKALQGATLWAAEAIGQARDRGSIEVGKQADLTVIAGNPLTDIGATKNVRMVIKNGEVVDTTYDPRFVNPIPWPFNPAPQP